MSSCKKDKNSSDDVENPELSIEPYYSAVVFSANGQTARANGELIEPTFEVATNEASWDVEISPSPSWLSYSRAGATFTLTAAVNESATPPAPVTVTVKGIKAQPVMFTVTQTGKINPELSIEPYFNAITFLADGRTFRAYGGSIDPVFFVTTNEGSWDVEISPSPSWLSYSRSGNILTLIAGPNEDFTSPPTATVTITGESAQPVMFNATQEIFSGELKNTSEPFAYQPNSKGWNQIALDWIVNEAAVTSGTVNFIDDLVVLHMGAFYDHPVPVMTNGKLYQTVLLDAGTYELSAVLYFGGAAGTNQMYLVAAAGVDLPNVNFVSNALGFAPITTPGTFSFEFSLTQRSVVSLGFVASLADAEAYFTQVNLQKK